MALDVDRRCCFRLIGRHAHEMLGLDPQGMIDDGTSSGFRALRVLEPEHRLFREPRRVHISADGTIGERSLNGPRVSGYEFDAVREYVEGDDPRAVDWNVPARMGESAISYL